MVLVRGGKVALDVVVVHPTPRTSVPLPLAFGVGFLDVLGLGKTLSGVEKVDVVEEDTDLRVAVLGRSDRRGGSGSGRSSGRSNSCISTTGELVGGEADFHASLSSRKQRGSDGDEGGKGKLHPGRRGKT